MLLHPVAAADLAQAWPIAEPWLAAACRRPGCDISAPELLALCGRGEAQLVLIHPEDGEAVAAGVTQVRDLERGGRSCCVLAVGGSGARAWRHTLRLIEAGAARVGCSRVEFVGRAGWAALLPDYAVDAYFTKELAA